MACFGCDLPPLPAFDAPDSGPDRVEPDASREALACEPRSQICVGNAVRTCSADGYDFDLESCGVSETCAGGVCVPIRSTCEEGQPFALSATELAFDVSDDYKTQTRQVRLANCRDAPILIRDAVVRGPERPDGTPVFRLSSEFAQVFVPPREYVDLKVVYRPTPGLSQVGGKLELSLVLDELTNVEIALRSKALCATTTPLLDFGVLQREETPELQGFLQNCGTEPLRLTEIDVGAHTTTRVTLDLPYDLLPGEEIPYFVSVPSNAALGQLDDRVSFSLEELQAPVTAAIRGFVRRIDCVDLTAVTPDILVNNQPLEPHPGGLVKLRFAGAPADVGHWVRLVEQPERSFERATPAPDGWTFKPRVIGQYRFEVHAIDEPTRRVSCKISNVLVDVKPRAPLHVELTWESDGDSIPSDFGFGHGANLDLHVLSSPDGGGAWNDGAADCYPGVVGACGGGQGAISVSQSGGVPEFATFGITDGLQFEMGIYLANPFNFDGVRARVRVYADAALIAELNSNKLQSANDFWLVGLYDGTTGDWAKIDSTFSGFPR